MDTSSVVPHQLRMNENLFPVTVDATYTPLSGFSGVVRMIFFWTVSECDAPTILNCHRRFESSVFWTKTFLLDAFNKTPCELLKLTLFEKKLLSEEPSAIPSGLPMTLLPWNTLLLFR
ncbi:MAG: hypothetical protein A3G34_09055 [Candidatus Lindowbacteria bacterium RIFCSPLOWO2_12_FULL_62_27]|nr:MAG: hypothetical protein A3G34_09055 [Candidatus Lindowbacteria bacterium RIFCSPLOWO2_12_FULL_62_27]